MNEDFKTLESLLLINFLVILYNIIIYYLITKNNICLLSNKYLCKEPEELIIDDKINYTCNNSKIYKAGFFSPIYTFIRFISYLIIILVILWNFFIINTEITNEDVNLFLLNMILVIILGIQFIMMFFITSKCKEHKYKCNLKFNIYDNLYEPGYKYIEPVCENNISKFLVNLVKLMNNLNIFNLILIIIAIIVFLKIISNEYSNWG
jgi:hypothetical protein